MIIDYYWEMISSFTYNFSRKITWPLLFKSAWIVYVGRWRKSDNIVKMEWIMVSINSTITLFSNYQIHVHKIAIKYSSINTFILHIVCFVISKIHYCPYIVRTKNYGLLAIIYSTLYWMITCLFYFVLTGKR